MESPPLFKDEMWGTGEYVLEFDGAELTLSCESTGTMPSLSRIVIFEGLPGIGHDAWTWKAATIAVSNDRLDREGNGVKSGVKRENGLHRSQRKRWQAMG